MSMQIAKAPTDPEKQRPFFYIYKDHELFGAKEDGRGVSYLYMNDGRLESRAKVVGNVQDEKLLELMGTVAGIRELVYAMGVSVEMEDKASEVEYIFQMYGKQDLYGGGANLETRLPADGSEHMIRLQEVDWKPDDDVPGQMKIYMPEPGKKAYLTVRFYLNDGFEAPPQIEEKPVDTASAEYKEMVAKSTIQMGNTCRIAKLIKKAKAGEDVTIAYIGGSITQGAGATPINTECYAWKSFCGIKALLGDGENIHYVKAGVGGTPSEFGMIRFDRDVLRDGKVSPDLVVIEFAVNDEGDETKGDCYESLVRKSLALPGEPAVLLLFSVFADDYNLQERLIPVGKRYDLPMVSVKDAVVPQFYDRENRIMTKGQYFYDCFHPTNLGHTVMADCIIQLVQRVMDAEETDTAYDPRMADAPAIGNTFDEVLCMDKKDHTDLAQIEAGGFTFTDTELQSVEMDLDLDVTPEFPYNWMYDGAQGSQGSFMMEVDCKALVVIMKDSGEQDAAVAKAYVDGEFVRDLDPYVNRWCHCNPLILIQEKESGHHRVEIRVEEEGERRKFTILGFGVVK